MATASSSSSIRNYSNSIGGRLSRVVPNELIELPEIGERTIYVTDEGLIVSTDDIR